MMPTTTPTESVARAAAQLANGSASANKSLVILLDTRGDVYEPQMFVAGLPASEILALLEVCKAKVLHAMGYGN
jgi:hypothetical protein